MSLYTVYNMMLLLSLMPHLSFHLDMLLLMILMLYNNFMPYIVLSFLMDNNIMLDIAFVMSHSLLSYNTHFMLSYNLSVMHSLDMFMLHLMLILHMPYNYLLIHLHYMIMPHNSYNYLRLYYMLLLLIIYIFMLHSSDMLLLIMSYIFMLHNTATLSHNTSYSHLMLSFIMLSLSHSLH